MSFCLDLEVEVTTHALPRLSLQKDAIAGHCLWCGADAARESGMKLSIAFRCSRSPVVFVVAKGFPGLD